MGITTGMRAKDLRSFMMVARQYNVIILVTFDKAIPLAAVRNATGAESRSSVARLRCR
jgi:hypothetical protein